MRKVSERNQQRLDQLALVFKEKANIDIHTRPCRKAEIIRGKASFINIAIRNMGVVLEQVADYLGYKDHTSVLHHRDNHHGRFKSDPDYADIYLMVSKEIAPGFDEESKEVFKLIKSISA